jgi:Fic family protein
MRGMTLPEEITAERWLRSTPYLVAEGDASKVRFLTVYRRSVATKARAETVAQQVAEDARGILEPFAKALRTDLVAESNTLEGYEWTRPQVQRVVEIHRELVTAPIHHFRTAMRSDRHLLEALGLYRAYVIADEWAENAARPREYEIRGLHSIILAGAPEAGRYKTRLNEIAGSQHEPLDPFEAGRAMAELTDWWMQGSPDPVLDATVVHAWLTHIHPFEDGNGRVARLLANLALTQAGYPPLIIRSGSDRGQYLDALATSDDGDILPLYDLFSSVLKRSVKTMSKPGYARDFVQDRLLKTSEQLFEGWLHLARHFTDCLRKAIRHDGWDALYQGYPDLPSFVLLSERDSGGNGWYLKILRPDGSPQWLLFFGYHTTDILDFLSGNRPTPSIFVSVRDDDPTAVHPYRWIMDADDEVPDEIVLTPGERKPALVRHGWDAQEMTLEDCANALASALTLSST